MSPPAVICRCRERDVCRRVGSLWLSLRLSPLLPTALLSLLLRTDPNSAEVFLVTDDLFGGPKFRRHPAKFMLPLPPWPRRGPLAAGWSAVPNRSRGGKPIGSVRCRVVGAKRFAHDVKTMETKVMKKLFTAWAVAGSLVVAGSAAMAAPISKPFGPALNVQGLFHARPIWRRLWLRLSATLLLCAPLLGLLSVSALLARARLRLSDRDIWFQGSRSERTGSFAF